MLRAGARGLKLKLAPRLSVSTPGDGRRGIDDGESVAPDASLSGSIHNSRGDQMSRLTALPPC